MGPLCAKALRVARVCKAPGTADNAASFKTFRRFKIDAPQEKARPGDWRPRQKIFIRMLACLRYRMPGGSFGSQRFYVSSHCLFIMINRMNWIVGTINSGVNKAKFRGIGTAMQQRSGSALEKIMERGK